MEEITFTKKDLIKRLSYKINMHYEDSKIICDCLLNTFHDLFQTDKERVRVELRNFGIFEIKKTKKRTNARNLKTNQPIIIPSRKRISFKPSKKMKNYLHENQ